MRKLSKRQEQALDLEYAVGVLDVADLSRTAYAHILGMNDHETFWQNANRYLADKYYASEDRRDW